MKRKLVFILVGTLASVAGALATTAVAVPVSAQGAAATYPLRVAIRWSGVPVVPCPTGYPATVACYAHPGAPVAVRGLGFVNQSYVYPVDSGSATCPAGTFTLRPYTARLSVRDKGEIFLALGGVDACLDGPPTDTVLSPTQAFSVTGGSGVFAGASGSGVVTRADIRREITGHGSGKDVWDGTLVAPGFEPDLTPPTITGAVSRTVRAARTATRVIVRYRVTARDTADGAVPVTCQPRSGSRFRVGRRTVVRCSATDRSVNTARATFTVTVRR